MSSYEKMAGNFFCCMEKIAKQNYKLSCDWLVKNESFGLSVTRGVYVF